ncbi:MAG: DUF4007 family protein [Fusobacterium perfoetens]|uniref:DUF4007 family protein n=1 Tax=Fusobacterium perfoetens TaxID=852 RepID=UPI0023F3E19C|nr:DUF4007 family protein [Fusobacterium perfoetens]MCI6152381.1 DUF4007 family protein [Fusobacterium perfoetens]MDY3236980.1 DUF4007 family protein [Fusobacterium perfoetens]
MKFRGHETFFIRKGWLTKGLKNIIKNPSVFMGTDGNPMDILGIGSNMVKSLRYWLAATGLSQEIVKQKKTHSLTDLGEIIWKNDPYLQEDGSLYIIHYKLVSNKELATTWYYFFNEFTNAEFTKEDLFESLKNYTIQNGLTVSDRLLEDDCNCLLNMYLSKNKISSEKNHPENNIISPFRDLEIIKITDEKEKVFRKNNLNSEKIHPLIILAVIVEQYKNKKEIKISSLLEDTNSIGKIFNLDILSLLKILSNLEKLGYIKVIRTAGLDVIKIEKEINFIDCLNKYYEAIKERE